MYSNLFRLFVVFALSLTVSAHSKHRHTFFFDKEALSSFTEEPIQVLAPKKIRVKNFTGVQEWKILTPLDDYKASHQNLPAWNKDWKVRVQIASGSQGLTHPFNIVPAFGIHFGISFGNGTFSHKLDYEKIEFITICKYLEALFGIYICESGQSSQEMYNLDISHSILLPDEHIYLYSSLPLNHQLPTKTSILGKNVYFKEHNRPLILDFDLRFDKKANQIITDLRMVWRYNNQDIYIIKENEQDKVELGVFGPQLDSETFIGERIVIGKDDNNPVPTMITASSRALSSNAFYFNSSVTPAQGFHQSFKTSITLPTSHENCELYILHIFPNSFLVDTYQINELFSDSDVQIFGEKDLENPVGVTSLKWGSLVLAKEHLVRHKDNVEFHLPFHMRYQPANSEGSQSHVVASAPWPLVVYACKNLVDDGQVPLFAQTPLPLSLLFPSTTKLEYILPKEEFLQRGVWPSEAVRIPVGQLDHLKYVERWSILFALIGCAWIIWTIKRMQIRNENYNKID